MLKTSVRGLFCSCLLFATGAFAGAAQNDITFVVAGKTANFTQVGDSDPRVLNYHFFAEIFLKANGKVSDASIRTPGVTGEEAAFEDAGYALEWHGGRYRSEAELEQNYPDGDYRFRYHTPSTGTTEQTVNLINSRSAGSALPRAPKIYLYQNDVRVAVDGVNPELDLEVRWSNFEHGRADPLNIMNDLLFVIMGDCHGQRQAHSGRPFEGTPYLDFSTTSYTIPAESLIAQSAYQLSVEHAILDTSIHLGVPGFATFATTTFIELSTTGIAAPGTACPKLLQPFDPGQADLQSPTDNDPQTVTHSQ